jgi:hypothetical protein
MTVAKTIRGVTVYVPSQAKNVFIPSGTDQAAVPADALPQMRNPGLWEGGVVPAAVTSAPPQPTPLVGVGLGRVVWTTREAYAALLAAGTARSDTVYLTPKA